MRCKPAILLNYPRRKPRVSVILVDWGVRESFHSLHYLNRQTAPRSDYELIWVEFYDHVPKGLRRAAADGLGNTPALDRWVTLGYPSAYQFHKHRLYNVGLLLARGDICVICDSDAVFQPTFIEKIARAFVESPGAVVHLDEVRNRDRAYYPFNYPSIEDLLGRGCANWQGTASLGLDNSPDMLHHANYGACMAARRRDLLAIGGADEHDDYLGYICGPYEMTFRLGNYGRTERWLRDEYLYHTWHPNTYGVNTDYHGPHDGFHISLLALQARGTFRVQPYVVNPWVARSQWGRRMSAGQLIQLAERHPEPAWHVAALPPQPAHRVYQIESNIYGFDIFHYAGTWYALRTGTGPLDPSKVQSGGYAELWQAPTHPAMRDRLPVDATAWEVSMGKGWLPGRAWRTLRAHPLHCLPARIARRARQLLASSHGRPNWWW